MATKKQAESMYLQMHMSAFWNKPMYMQMHISAFWSTPMLTEGPYYLKFGPSYTTNNQGKYFNHDLPILSPLEKCKVIAKYYNQIEVKDGNNATCNCIEDNDVAWLRVSWKKLNSNSDINYKPTFFK
jgi:hypothetical protein